LKGWGGGVGFLFFWFFFFNKKQKKKGGGGGGGQESRGASHARPVVRPASPEPPFGKVIQVVWLCFGPFRVCQLPCNLLKPRPPFIYIFPNELAVLIKGIDQGYVYTVDFESCMSHLTTLSPPG